MVVGLSIDGPDLANALACMNEQCEPAVQNGLQQIFGTTKNLFHPCKHANGTDIDRSAQFRCGNESRNHLTLQRSVQLILKQIAESISISESAILAIEELELEEHARSRSVTANQVASTIIKTIEDVDGSLDETEKDKIVRIVAQNISFIYPTHQHHRADTGEGTKTDDVLQMKPFQILRKEKPLPRQILAGVGKRGRDFFTVSPLSQRTQKDFGALPRSMATEKNKDKFFLAIFLILIIFAIFF